MSRIRSVHPGLWTDERFVELSDAAQILWIGLWTECDDQGVFLWKASTLKMRLRPNTTVSIEPALAELESSDCVRAYEVAGRKYGAVRNFRRHQRPKKPNSTHPVPQEFRTYLGLDNDDTEPEDATTPPSSPPVPHQFGTERLSSVRIPEKSPQMEDGGCRMKEEKEKDSILELGEGGGGGENFRLVSISPKTAPSKLAAHSRQKPRTTLANDWMPSDETIEFAHKTLGWTADVGQILENFSNHHEAKGSLMADWNAAFRTWINRESEFRKGASHAG